MILWRLIVVSKFLPTSSAPASKSEGLVLLLVFEHLSEWTAVGAGNLLAVVSSRVVESREPEWSLE